MRIDRQMCERYINTSYSFFRSSINVAAIDTYIEQCWIRRDRNAREKNISDSAYNEDDDDDGDLPYG